MAERKCALVGEQCVYPNCACYPTDDESLHAKQLEESGLPRVHAPTPPAPAMRPPAQPVRYVVGFAMGPSDVLLLTKAKPEWQAGMLNGVGGKVEPTDPNLRAAMVREFFEETGVQVCDYNWTLFHSERFGAYGAPVDESNYGRDLISGHASGFSRINAEVYFFYARVGAYILREACENTAHGVEPCSVHPWRALPQHCIGNLDYLLLMAAHYWHNMMNNHEYKNPSPWVSREMRV